MFGPHDISNLLAVATGRQEASMYLENGNLINVFTGEIYPANIAICRDRIAYVGQSRDMVGNDTTVINADGYYLCPALIEPHFHPCIAYNPVCIAEDALRRGITTLTCDNLFLVLRLGITGFLKMINTLDDLPVRLLWTARPVFPTRDPDYQALFSIENLKELFQDEHIIKTAEITHWPLIIEGNREVLEKISLALEHRLGIEGHTAGCSYDKLNPIAAIGVESCHEAINAEEAQQRLRLGFWTMLRHSSLRPDLPNLLDVITDMHLDTKKMLFTNDGPSPGLIVREGLLDGMLRIAVAGGVKPVTALQITTLNAATYLGLDKELGSIAPGRQADILLLPDLKNFAPQMVIAKGKLAVKDGKVITPLTAPDWGKIWPKTDLPWSYLVDDPNLFKIPAQEPMVFPVIKLVSAAITRKQDQLIHPRAGFLARHDDILYCTVIDRRGNRIINGFISGIGQFDAFATTFNNPFCLLVMGKEHALMSKAAVEVAKMNGGIVLYAGRENIFRMPLDLGGMMSSINSFQIIGDQIVELEEKVRGLGYPYHDFLYTIRFLVADSLPRIRITPSGIIDVKKQTVLVPSQNVNQKPHG